MTRTPFQEFCHQGSQPGPWRDHAAARIEALEQDSANLASLTGELATRDAIEANLRARIEALEAEIKKAHERIEVLERSLQMTGFTASP